MFHFDFLKFEIKNGTLSDTGEVTLLEIKKAKCRLRVKELYKKSRSGLNTEEKKLFNLPLAYRLKGSAAGMLLWIERVELSFQHREQDENNNLITRYWWYKQSKKWRQMKEDIT